jgi:hypothetical protein
MNKKVLVIAVALMAVAMLATPLFGVVSACGHRGRWGQPTEKIEITAFGPLGSYSAPEYWIRRNIIHGRGATCNAPTLISWQTPPYLPSNPNADPTKYLFGPSEWIADYDVNLKTGKGVLRYTVEITLTGGTFKGTINLHGTFAILNPEPDVYYANQLSGFRRGVLHGSGDYKGWKLVISGETTDGTTTFENYLYKPL